jgi:hypothetical protein
MSTPSFTPAQYIAALVTVLMNLLADYGMHISDAAKADILTVSGLALVGGIAISDAIIRHGRSRALAPPNVLQTSNAMGAAVPAGAADPPPPVDPSSTPSGAAV